MTAPFNIPPGHVYQDGQQLIAGSGMAPLYDLDAAIGDRTLIPLPFQGSDVSSALGAARSELQTARGVYGSLGSRLDSMMLAGGQVTTTTVGTQSSGSSLVVASTGGFIAGARIAYIQGSSVTYNTVTAVTDSTHLALGTALGGTVPAGSLVSQIDEALYELSQAINHSGTLTADKTMQYAAGNVFNVRAYGAVGDGVADDTGALAAAISAASAHGGIVLVPANTTCIVTSTLAVPNPAGARLVVRGPGTVSFAFGSTDAVGKLFNVTGNNVHFEDLTIDGTPMGAGYDSAMHDGQSPPNGLNRYAIYAAGADSTHHLSNVTVRRCQFLNLATFWYDQPNGAHIWASNGVCHCVYMSNVDHGVVADCVMEAPSGAAVFLRSTLYASVARNSVNNTGWYSLHCEADNHHFEFVGNSVTGTTQYCRYWGGSIDVMGQQAGNLPVDTHGRIIGNYISGVHLYGSGIRLSSCRHMTVIGNVFDNLQVSVLSGVTTQLGAITVTARGAQAIVDGSGNLVTQATDMSNRAPAQITISDNLFIAGPALNGATNIGLLGIYVQNATPAYVASNTTPTTPPGYQVNYASGFVITGNLFVCGYSSSFATNSPAYTGTLSNTSGNYWQNAIILHGQDGGLRKVTVAGNHCWGRPLSTAGAVAGGAILVTGQNTLPSGTPWAPRPVSDVTVRDNTCKWYQGLYDTGYANGTNGAAKLEDLNKSWATNSRAGWVAVITAGTGAGSRATVASNSATVLTMTGNWSPAATPDATSQYQISELADATSGAIGIYLLSNVDRVTVENNTCEGWYVGLWVDASAVGPNSDQAKDLRYLDENTFLNSFHLDSFLGSGITIGRRRQLVLSGTTRPAAAAVQDGYMFYDKTLGKPIWRNGTVWKDATGGTV